MTKDTDTNLSKAIEAWRKRKSAVVNDLHKLTVRVCIHCVQHGDATYINKLDQAIGDGTDAKGNLVSGINLFSFRRYVVERGGVSWSKEKGQAGSFIVSKDRRDALKAEHDKNPDEFRDTMMANPFWMVVKAPDPFEGFDLLAAIKAQLAKAKRLVMDDSKKDKVNIVGIERVERLALELEKARKTEDDTTKAIAARFAATKKETADPVANAKTVQKRAAKRKATPVKAAA